jgi:hypothetical protein
MLDLEQAISEWRQGLAASRIAATVIDELESHLREEIMRQIESGSSAADAFEYAMRRIGPAGMLKAEFERAQELPEAGLRKWAGIAYTTEIVAYTLLQIRQLARSAPTDGELRLGIAALVVTMVLAYSGWRWVPSLWSLIASQRVRRCLGIGGCIAGPAWLVVFALWILPRFDFTPGGFAVVLLWALMPLVTLPTLLVGMEQAKAN